MTLAVNRCEPSSFIALTLWKKLLPLIIASISSTTPSLPLPAWSSSLQWGTVGGSGGSGGDGGGIEDKTKTMSGNQLELKRDNNLGCNC